MKEKFSLEPWTPLKCLLSFPPWADYPWVGGFSPQRRVESASPHWEPFLGGWGYHVISRKMSLNYALGLLMYSCRFCS